MTVAFAPARGARWGTEYCETHIDAHFGVYRTEKSRETGLFKPKLKFAGLVHLRFRKFPREASRGLMERAKQRFDISHNTTI